MKGEIRFGVWVEGTSGVGHEFQGFRWRHWYELSQLEITAEKFLLE
jgi:hypothetical protein